MHEIERLTILASQFMRCMQPLGSICDDSRRKVGIGRKRLFFVEAHDLTQRFAMEVFHRNPIRIFMDTEIKHLRYVGVRNARRDASLIEEHVNELLVLDEMGMDPFDRHPLLKPPRSVHTGQMHTGHTPHPNLVNHPIAPEKVGAISSIRGARA
ncbi:MAG: hypothetical protein BWY17_04822 [Deltaproteobacteria bacterium ADurb.Bin207]|nr:MAG: hypothetical protein BWY17_04822 [Deltaproteobacteria bacterium ADurb.Bin207]